jgi:hypothetical protein
MQKDTLINKGFLVHLNLISTFVIVFFTFIISDDFTTHNSYIK